MNGRRLARKSGAKHEAAGRATQGATKMQAETVVMMVKLGLETGRTMEQHEKKRCSLKSV